MPAVKRTFIRVTIASMLIGAFVLLGIVGANLWLVEQTRDATELVNAARVVRAVTVNLRSSVQDAETGQRGYLLTDRAEYLAPYDSARSTLAMQMKRLHDVTDPNPELKALTDPLDPAIAAKMAELQETIDLFRAGQRDAAFAIVNGDRGKIAMDQVRQILGDVVDKAEHEVRIGLEQQSRAMGALRAITISGAIVILVVLGGYTFIVFRYTRELLAAEESVRALNAGLEERILERTTDLARANEEIQRFAYIVTHDLRAPLVNIMGFTAELDTSLAAVKAYVEEPDPAKREAHFAALRVAGTEDLPEAIGFIRSSTRKMDGLINAILKLSREGRRTLTPVPIDLERLLASAAESVRHQVVEAGGDIVIDGKAPSLVSDRLALDQIFGNLLDNAVKYRDRARPINISIRLRQGLGDTVVVDIEDNGRGIATQDHERVFDLFRRSGPQDQPGEGIGLAHVRTMARTLGGNITLASNLGQGTTFTLTIARDLRRFIQGSTL